MFPLLPLGHYKNAVTLNDISLPEFRFFKLRDFFNGNLLGVWYHLSVEYHIVSILTAWCAK
jgi:hypothetical protein